MRILVLAPTPAIAGPSRLHVLAIAGAGVAIGLLALASAVIAAMVAGGFTTANTILTVYLTHRLPPRKRRRRRSPRKRDDDEDDDRQPQEQL